MRVKNRPIGRDGMAAGCSRLEPDPKGHAGISACLSKPSIFYPLAPRFQLSQPDDHVAIVLPMPAHGPQPVKLTAASTWMTHWPPWSCTDNSGAPSGNVAMRASWAAGVIAMRIIGFVTIW